MIIVQKTSSVVYYFLVKLFPSTYISAQARIGIDYLTKNKDLLC